MAARSLRTHSTRYPSEHPQPTASTADVTTSTARRRTSQPPHQSNGPALVSHRSGETGDAFIADRAVGTGSAQPKSGAPARGEHVTEYNRLSEIAGSQPTLPFGLSPSA